MKSNGGEEPDHRAEPPWNQATRAGSLFPIDRATMRSVSFQELLMGLFCDHDWAPRTGMDSGSYCQKCGATSSREYRSGGALSNGELAPKPSLLSRLNCLHNWESAAEGGSVCARCGATSSRPSVSPSPLSDGELAPARSSIEALADWFAHAFSSQEKTPSSLARRDPPSRSDRPRNPF